MFKIAIWLGVFVVTTAILHPLRAEIIPGLSYERMETSDANGEKVTFYITHPDPLALVIQGSGCIPLFETGVDGERRTGIPDLMQRAAKGRLTLLAVEKPFSTPTGQRQHPKDKGQVGCSLQFLEQDTFDNRLQQLLAALNVAKDLPWIQAGPVLVVGWGEGADLAAS